MRVAGLGSLVQGFGVLSFGFGVQGFSLGVGFAPGGYQGVRVSAFRVARAWSAVGRWSASGP